MQDEARLERRWPRKLAAAEVAATSGVVSGAARARPNGTSRRASMDYENRRVVHVPLCKATPAGLPIFDADGGARPSCSRDDGLVYWSGMYYERERRPTPHPPVRALRAGDYARRGTVVVRGYESHARPRTPPREGGVHPLLRFSFHTTTCPLSPRTLAFAGFDVAEACQGPQQAVRLATPRPRAARAQKRRAEGAARGDAQVPRRRPGGERHAALELIEGSVSSVPAVVMLLPNHTREIGVPLVAAVSPLSSSPHTVSCIALCFLVATCAAFSRPPRCHRYDVRRAAVRRADLVLRGRRALALLGGAGPDPVPAGDGRDRRAVRRARLLQLQRGRRCVDARPEHGQREDPQLRHVQQARASATSALWGLLSQGCAGAPRRHRPLQYPRVSLLLPGTASLSPTASRSRRRIWATTSLRPVDRRRVPSSLPSQLTPPPPARIAGSQTNPPALDTHVHATAAPFSRGCAHLEPQTEPVRAASCVWVCVRACGCACVLADLLARARACGECACVYMYTHLACPLCACRRILSSSASPRLTPLPATSPTLSPLPR